MRPLLQIEKQAKALSDQTRLRILAMLGEGALCVCQMTTVVGLATATVSRHLSILHDAGFLKQAKKGRWVFYSLNEDREADDPCFRLLAELSDDPQIIADQKRLQLVTSVPAEELCAKGMDDLMRRHPGLRPASAQIS